MVQTVVAMGLLTVSSVEQKKVRISLPPLGMYESTLNLSDWLSVLGIGVWLVLAIVCVCVCVCVCVMCVYVSVV